MVTLYVVESPSMSQTRLTKSPEYRKEYNTLKRARQQLFSHVSSMTNNWISKIMKVNFFLNKLAVICWQKVWPKTESAPSTGERYDGQRKRECSGVIVDLTLYVNIVSLFSILHVLILFNVDL